MMVKLLKKFINFELNTPEKYWLVIGGYHIHKSFWGTLLVIFSIISFIFISMTLGILALSIGIIILLLSIFGHIKTNNHPYFKLWDKYENKRSMEN